MSELQSATECQNNTASLELSVVESFIALFRHEMRTRNIGPTQLANMLEWHRNRVTRVLNRPKYSKVEDITAISDVLDIDRSLAMFAIDTLGDWSAYYDPALQVSVNMLGRVVAKINERRTCDIELLPAAAIEILTDWIVRTIIDNQEQICSRREAMVPMPKVL